MKEAPLPEKTHCAAEPVLCRFVVYVGDWAAPNLHAIPPGCRRFGDVPAASV